MPSPATKPPAVSASVTTPQDRQARIAWLLDREAICWAIHARQMRKYGKALQALPKRDESVPYNRFSDPNYRAIERLDRLYLDRANAAYLRAWRCRNERRALEGEEAEAEWLRGRMTGDPFSEVAA